MLRVPNLDTPECLTDWMEASLLALPQVGRVADADLQESLQEAGHNREDELELIIQQSRQRQHVLGPHYPFERDGLGFRARGTWDQHLCYSFLLFVSLNQAYTELRHRQAAREPAILFELVTARSLELFLGAQAIRIGAPREPPVPAGFPAALAHLGAAIGEPEHPNGDLERHGSGDDGLDVWTIKSFQDERPSNIFVLAQCAIGTDWGDKRSELNLDLWHRHIDWFTQPLRAFAVPFQINQNSWRETATTGGLILDRIRIALTTRAADLPDPITQRMEGWIRARIEQTLREINE